MYWFRSQHALDDIIACSKTRTRNNLGLSFCKCQKLNFVLIHDNFLLLTPDSYEGNEGQVVQKTALKITPWFSETKSITHSHVPLDPEGTKLIPGLGCLFWVWCLVFNSWFSSVIFFPDRAMVPALPSANDLLISMVLTALISCFGHWLAEDSMPHRILFSWFACQDLSLAIFPRIANGLSVSIWRCSFVSSSLSSVLPHNDASDHTTDTWIMCS